MLLRMKDEENKPWNEIRSAWEKATGETVGGSTLSNRYQRIKANFTIFSSEDVSIYIFCFRFFSNLVLVSMICANCVNVNRRPS